MIENAQCKMTLMSQRAVRPPLRYSLMPPPPQRLDREWALRERDRDRRIQIRRRGRELRQEGVVETEVS